MSNHNVQQSLYSPVSPVENKQILWDEFEQYYKSTDFTWREKFLLIVSLCTYFSDVFSDGYLAFSYHNTGNTSYFVLTLTFVLVPAVVMSIFNHFEYINYVNFVHKQRFPFIGKWGKVLRKLCIVLLISPVPRYVEAWINGEKYMKAKREGDKGRMYMYFLFMYVEKRTATLNSLIESFLESAPQLILQLYIVAAGTNQSQYDFWRGASQAFSIATSVFSLSLALTKFTQLLQSVDANNHEEEPSRLANGVLFLAHLTEIAARAFAISLFACVFGWIVWPVILVHIAIVLLCLYLLKYELHYRQLEHYNNVRKFPANELLFFVLLGSIVSTFAYLPNGSKFRPIHYHALCFVENVLMIALWWAFSTGASARLWYHDVFFIGHFVLFTVGVGLSVIFYEYRHNIDGLASKLTSAMTLVSRGFRRIF